LGEMYVVCELRSTLWKGGWRRIARFINRQAVSIGEKLAFAIRGDFGSMMCANSLAIVNRKAGVLENIVFSHRYCCLPGFRKVLDVGVRIGCWMFGSCYCCPFWATIRSH